jgi:exodeoxyribonuclease VII large subunit
MPAERDWSISVSQLNEYVRKLLSGDPMLRSIKVSGEISGFKKHVSGHLYFTLKDEGARVQCVMFRQNALYLNFTPRDGMRVVISASASLYAQSGAYQLYAESMRQEGAGELFVRFEMLKRRLAEEGLFDPSLKKPIPMLPKTIGVVTSRTGAVLRDIVRVARRRNPNVNILLAASAVQGASAASEIVSALDRLNRDGRADVILCGRGGGSIEDLWPFNEEIVARAIARSRIPVISCVGHETDFTIADFVADLRAPTPSAAAELAVPIISELSRDVDDLIVRMTRSLMTGQEMRRAQLEHLSGSPVLAQPRKAILDGRRHQADMLSARLNAAGRRIAGEGQHQALDALTKRMEQAMTRGMQKRRARSEELDRTLCALSPLAVLERGYALISLNNRSVTSAGEIPEGTRFDVRMKDGHFAAVRVRDEQ